MKFCDAKCKEAKPLGTCTVRKYWVLIGCWIFTRVISLLFWLDVISSKLKVNKDITYFHYTDGWKPLISRLKFFGWTKMADIEQIELNNVAKCSDKIATGLSTKINSGELKKVLDSKISEVNDSSIDFDISIFDEVDVFFYHWR